MLKVTDQKLVRGQPARDVDVDEIGRSGWDSGKADSEALRLSSGFEWRVRRSNMGDRAVVVKSEA